MSQIHTVIVILEAIAGKETGLKEALMTIAELSRQEDSCLSYHVIQDVNQPTRFALYEQWRSAALHQEQFSKPYIIEFGKEAEHFLAKPYEGVFGNEVGLVVI